MISIAQRIADELNVRLPQVDAAIALLDDKATVPFIARYRKEATGGLDDTQLRTLEERLTYLRELEERRAAILKSIEEQGKLTPELAASINDADTKARLEDLYLPYKPKRRTKAQIAREAGLEPLALALLADPTLVPEARGGRASSNAEKGVADVGGRARRRALDPDGDLRRGCRAGRRPAPAAVGARRVDVRRSSPARRRRAPSSPTTSTPPKPCKSVPSHRALALLRGRKEGFLRLAVVLPEATADATRTAVGTGAAHRGAGRHRATAVAARADAGGVRRRKAVARDAWLPRRCAGRGRSSCWRRCRSTSNSGCASRPRRKRSACSAATCTICCWPRRPASACTMGLDPGIRTGVKVAVVDGTGKLLDTATVYPHEPRNDWEGSLRTLGALCAKHGVQLISIGNGTASRETDKLAGDLIDAACRAAADQGRGVRGGRVGLFGLRARGAGVSESRRDRCAARSRSRAACRIRSPSSCASSRRRSASASISTTSTRSQLAKKLDAVVEDCVNAVGADVNTASAPLLARISGLTETIAEEHRRVPRRARPVPQPQQLLKVPRLGERTFEQAAGFLRIMNGDNPLDASAVHPEAYPVVERIVAQTGVPVAELIGNAAVLRALTPEDVRRRAVRRADGEGHPGGAREAGPRSAPGVQDRDVQGRRPRDCATFEPGMLLEGVVTNVANFGAFVDIGVHQDGLVHVSQLADRFVKDPREVVKAGDIVKVKVVEVDLKRQRIALTMKKHDMQIQGERRRPIARAATRRRAPRRGTPRRRPLAHAAQALPAAATIVRNDGGGFRED